MQLTESLNRYTCHSPSPGAIPVLCTLRECVPPVGFELAITAIFFTQVWTRRSVTVSIDESESLLVAVIAYDPIVTFERVSSRSRDWKHGSTNFWGRKQFRLLAIYP